MEEYTSCDNCKYYDKREYEQPCCECIHSKVSKYEPADKQAEGRKLDEKIGRILDKHGRPKPMPGAVPYYEHDYSEIPEKIRISFSDGQTAVYELRIDQPHPVIVENIRIIRKWKQGYVNQPARRRNRK